MARTPTAVRIERISHTFAGAIIANRQCLGVLFTDDVELEEHEDKPYALWIKKTRITEDKEIELVWDTKPLMFCTKEEIPDMTQWLYNWALLGGYKESQ